MLVNKSLERKVQGRFEKLYEVPEGSFEVQIQSFILIFEASYQSFVVREHKGTALTETQNYNFMVRTDKKLKAGKTCKVFYEPTVFDAE